MKVGGRGGGGGGGKRWSLLEAGKATIARHIHAKAITARRKVTVHRPEVAQIHSEHHCRLLLAENRKIKEVSKLVSKHGDAAKPRSSHAGVIVR